MKYFDKCGQTSIKTQHHLWLYRVPSLANSSLYQKGKIVILDGQTWWHLNICFEDGGLSWYAAHVLEVNLRLWLTFLANSYLQSLLISISQILDHKACSRIILGLHDACAHNFILIQASSSEGPSERGSLKKKGNNRHKFNSTKLLFEAWHWHIISMSQKVIGWIKIRIFTWISAQ